MSEQLSIDPEPEPQPELSMLPDGRVDDEQLPEHEIINRLSNVSSRLLESDMASGHVLERFIENERGDRLHRSISEGSWRYSLFLKGQHRYATERITWQLGQQNFQHRSEMSAAEVLESVEKAFAWETSLAQEATTEERVTLRIKARATLGRLAAAIAGRPAMS